MNLRKLGTIEVSLIGMGCMGFSHGYGEIPSEEYSIEAIQKGHDFGCTFFDTAEAYGPNLLPENRGHNEKLVGNAVKGFRKDIIIATKLHLPYEKAQEKGVYQAVKDHLTASMQRLQTDYVDLYYLHRFNRKFTPEEIAEAMGRLIDEGLIRGWGMSQVPVEVIAKANAVTPLSAIQSIYSMIERGVEKDVIPYCEEHNIGFVPFSPVASGFLSGKVSVQSDFSHSDDVRKFVPQLKKENIEANQPILDLIHQYASEKNATDSQISLAWMLHKYPHVVPIPGSKKIEHILENLGAWNVELSDEEFTALDAALNNIPVSGHRGYVEFEGDTMANWDRK